MRADPRSRSMFAEVFTMHGSNHAGSSGSGRGRVSHSKHHDPYERGAKSPGTVVCDACGLVGHAGRWYVGAPPVGELSGGLCPACARIRDRYPAATIRIGARHAERFDEIRRMIANSAEAERAEHPLERVMDAALEGGRLVVHTTGLHVARRIVSKLERTLHAKAEIHYPDEQQLALFTLE
ncbi:MAG: BCAM0308 family protein [Planctomycetota bacterium]